MPLAKSLLAEETLTSLLDPLPPQPLRKETTLADAIGALNESGSGELLVLDEKQRLWASLDRDDLYHIIARIAATPTDTRGDISQRKLGDLLLGTPVYVSLEDSTLVASATMLDHGISWLPVVQSKDDPRPVGCLRGERIGNRMIQKIANLNQDRVRTAS